MTKPVDTKIARTKTATSKPVSPLEYPIHELQVLARMQRELLSAEKVDQEKARILAQVIEEKLSKMRAAWDLALATKGRQKARVHGAPDQIM
jgi:chorismate mutase